MPLSQQQPPQQPSQQPPQQPPPSQQPQQLRQPQQPPQPQQRQPPQSPQQRQQQAPTVPEPQSAAPSTPAAAVALAATPLQPPTPAPLAPRPAAVAPASRAASTPVSLHKSRSLPVPMPHPLVHTLSVPALRTQPPVQTSYVMSAQLLDDEAGGAGGVGDSAQLDACCAPPASLQPGQWSWLEAFKFLGLSCARCMRCTCSHPLWMGSLSRTE